MVNDPVSKKSTRAYLVAIVLVALAIAAVPATADDGGETRSTVAFGPDLAVSAADITLSKSVLLSGVAFNVSVKVYNLGDEDASSVNVDLLVDTESVRRVTLDIVEVDTWQLATFQLSLHQGDHEIGVLVDAEDAIDERREDNNGATMEVHVRGLPDATVTDADLQVSDEHPMEGDVLTISAMVRNLGESAATLVVVQFWDGIPGSGYLIANRTTSVPEAGKQLVTTQWDTTGRGGAHEINVVLARVLPAEDVLTNNAASITVLVFTHWDLVIDASTGDVTIDQGWTQDGFVTVREGATLTISGVVFEFLQDYPNQFALFVEDGGTLVLDSATVESDQDLLVILEDGTSLLMSSGSILQANVMTYGDVTIGISDGILVGGLQGNVTSVSLASSEVTGPIDLGSGDLMVESSILISGTPCTLTATRAVFTDTSLSGFETSLELLDGATAELRNVTCGNVVADEGSQAFIFRRVAVLVVDESSLVVPGATIEVRHFINGTVVASAVGEDDGMVEVEILSDVIEGGESHFIGNYLVWSTFSEEAATEALLLTPFPAMDSDANQPACTVVLPPVEPSALMVSTEGDMIVGEGEDLSLVADFIQDGNIIVEGTLTVVSSKLSVLQDREHQFYVAVEGNGRLVLSGGELTSDKPLNVYLHDNAVLEMTNGAKLSVNALVAKHGATVDANGATITARILLRGGQVALGNGCIVMADLMVVESPSVSIKGGTVTVDELRIDAPATAIEGIELQATAVTLRSTSFANVSDSSWVVETLHVEATILTVTGTTLRANEPLNLSVATLYMDSSSSNVLLGTTSPDSKIYLYDAVVPRPFSTGDATVLVFWYLTVTVQDVLGNPVANSPVEIGYTNNGTEVASGVTNDDGQVRFPLLGSIVGPDGEHFVGNYRIVARNPFDSDSTVVRYVNLDRAKTMISGFSVPLVPPTMIGVEISVENTTVIAGMDFNVTGTATAIFPTVRSALRQGIVEVQLWNNGSTWSNTSSMNEDGTFSFIVPAPLVDGVYYVKAVVTPTGEYAEVDPGVSNVISLDIEPPAPEVLYIILSPSKIEEFPAGSKLTVKGTVKYNHAEGKPAPNARVIIVDAITKTPYQTQADGLGEFEHTLDGPSFFGQYNYQVSAKDEALGISSEEDATLVVLAVEIEPEEPEDESNLLLIVVIIIIVAVATIAGTLSYWALSSRGRMVECGECGTLVPETATECPKCGIEFEIEVAKCSVCESWIKSDASNCPYCGTPFRDLEGIEEGDQRPPEEGGEVEVTEQLEVVVEDDEAVPEEPALAEEEPALETVKKVPEGLKKEVKPRPVVARKTVREVAKEPDQDEGDANVNGSITPRPVVRKVASQPPTFEDDVPGPADREDPLLELEDEEES